MNIKEAEKKVEEIMKDVPKGRVKPDYLFGSVYSVRLYDSEFLEYMNRRTIGRLQNAK